MALVAPVAECIEAAQRIKNFINSLTQKNDEPIRKIINQAFDNRADISPTSVSDEVRNAVSESINLLDSGQARVAD